MKELIRMNQLAGIITESQAKKMIAILNENEGNPIKIGSTMNSIEELEPGLKSMFPNSKIILKYDEEGDHIMIDGRISISDGAYQKWDTYNHETDEEKSFTNDKDLINFLKSKLG